MFCFQGLRVLGLATRSCAKLVGNLSKEDERDMCFQGFLAFLDPLKESSGSAIKGLNAKGVEVKVGGCIQLCSTVLSPHSALDEKRSSAASSSRHMTNAQSNDFCLTYCCCTT